MNISVNWLRSIAPAIEGSPEELARRLSLQAVAVDLVETVGTDLGDVVVGRVLRAVPHPDADRLTLCSVDAGAGKPLDVVCGAPEVVEGALYPFIPPGGTLPGGFAIEKRKIRGIVSHGMLCSEKELGLGRDAGGILRLKGDHRPGVALSGALDLPDDRLVLDLTPNRVDLASHVGVARELADRGTADIELPRFGTEWMPSWADDAASAAAAGVSVTIEDPARCYRYLAAVVRDVAVGPSPDWLASRLRAAGARPINNVVDATNYVLLELGQPLHAFDLDRLDGPEIRVRPAREGEALATLDGASHTLDARVTVIADANSAVALAGVMGGEDSEVTAETTNLLIECAAFDPAATRATATATGLSTDASYRFERGIDEAGLELALVRCVELILAVAGGAAEAAAVRVGREAPAGRSVRLRPARVRKLLGLRLSDEQIEALLGPLGFSCRADTSGTGEPALTVAVPTWRSDVTREVDVIEEVARRYGYERFPQESRSIRPSSVAEDPTWARRRSTRRLFESRGLLEARSLPMVGVGRTGEDRVELRNPLSATESVLRTDLVPPLLERLELNFALGRRSVRLYEIGSVFAYDPDGGGADGRENFLEEARAALVVTGAREPEHWSEESADVDVWDLRGLAEDVAERLLASEVRPLESRKLPPPEPGRPAFGVDGWLDVDAFAMFDDGRLVGVAGRVQPDAVDSPPWAGPVFAAEFRLDAVKPAPPVRFEPRPAYPAATRDLALIVPAGVSAYDIDAAVRGSAPAELAALRPFDVYEGRELDGRRSIAWRLVFRSVERTLTDEEVDRHVDRIVSHLTEELDVTVRDS